MKKKISENLKSNFSNFWLFSLLISALFLWGCDEKKEPVDRRIKRINPEQTAQMAKEMEAIINPELAEGLSLRLWGVDSLVADPVSIDIDDKGHLFYISTNRRKSSEMDIRSHQDWEAKSIQLQTIEDKRTFLHDELSPENSHRNNGWPI